MNAMDLKQLFMGAATHSFKFGLPVNVVNTKEKAQMRIISSQVQIFSI